ncbi:hypothetical protein VTK56DRAFT_7471 [Thermocarpiscus australiensis]
MPAGRRAEVQMSTSSRPCFFVKYRASTVHPLAGTFPLGTWPNFLLYKQACTEQKTLSTNSKFKLLTGEWTSSLQRSDRSKSPWEGLANGIPLRIQDFLEPLAYRYLSCKTPRSYNDTTYAVVLRAYPHCLTWGMHPMALPQRCAS